MDDTTTPECPQIVIPFDHITKLLKTFNYTDSIAVLTVIKGGYAFDREKYLQDPPKYCRRTLKIGIKRYERAIKTLTNLNILPEEVS